MEQWNNGIMVNIVTGYGVASGECRVTSVESCRFKLGSYDYFGQISLKVI